MDAHTLISSLVKRRIRRQIEDFFDRLGPKRVRFMIANNRSFKDFVTPGVEADIQRRASALSVLMEDGHLAEMIPGWVTAIAKEHGEQGQQWLEDNIAWIKGLVTSRR